MTTLTKEQKKRLDVALAAGTQRGILYAAIIQELKKLKEKPPSKHTQARVAEALKAVPNDDVLRQSANEEERKKLLDEIVSTIE